VQVGAQKELKAYCHALKHAYFAYEPVTLVAALHRTPGGHAPKGRDQSAVLAHTGSPEPVTRTSQLSLDPSPNPATNPHGKRKLSISTSRIYLDSTSYTRCWQKLTQRFGAKSTFGNRSKIDSFLLL
jgi:hypothetical protein